MRTLILALLSSTALSMPVPKGLEDGKVNVKLKSGKDYKFSSNEWFVGNRAASDRYHAKLNKRMQDLRDEIARLRARKITTKAPYKKHRFDLHLGYGQTGLELERVSDGVEAYQRVDFIGGATYSYRFTERYNISFTGVTSLAGFVGFGVNW